jgi:uncharacterized protein YbjT (DUF2867 family)
MAETLLVLGGSGFIGREICRRAIADGHTVISVSRSGRPNTDARWTDDVQWVTADVFAPNEWREHLSDATAVVHSIAYISADPRSDAQFERINGDSAIIAAAEAVLEGIETFVFLSAAFEPPIIPEAYLAAKRRAERAICGLDCRLVVLRPGPVYGSGGHGPPGTNAAMRLIDGVSSVDDDGCQLGDARPLSVESVAATAVRAVSDETLSGIIDVETMRRSGSRGSVS